MKRWFVMLWLGAMLLALAGCRSPVPSVEAQAPAETIDLYRQVQLLNLINGLELTPEQMSFILERARQVQEERDSLQEQVAAGEMDAILEEIRDTLMAGQNLSPELKDRFFAAKADNEHLREMGREELTRLAGEVEGILEDHQIYALERYVPCIIPPPGELRIGQAQATGGGALLERLRALPTARFDRNREVIARRVMEQLQKRFRGQVLILDKEEEQSRILDLMERVRALSEMELELEKEALLEELLAPYQVTRPPVEPVTLIARHLLDPAIIPLLEEKLAQVAL